MTEKRSDYRKQVKRKKNNNLLHTIKSAFDGEDEEVDVNPDFKRDPEEKERKIASGSKVRQHATREAESQKTTKQGKEPSADKALLLKKKLNRAILIVIVLIVLVLLALFHL
ncbi:hypothetical protein OZX58_03690 [Lactobacillus sp. ESL0680]|uniref:hypothetical protein n=1 Tax=Lactobacillus sp. ESL0680 TaxID=2983210 RepID=UPI0023F7F37A|nr:hypothetical protein [Lactobacillus sp. ESL0680]WEV39352.1 hypothetical protein OZX58_03690 [Lactobacillus sp. ESL0680]